MGFFIADDEAKDKLKKPRAVIQVSTAPKIKKSNIINVNEIGCQFCTLKEVWPRILSRQMQVSGAADADILLLGEAPGKEEDDQGAAFVGPSGKMLRGAIPGRMRDRVAFQNIVRCRPDNNRDPTPQEAHACSTYLSDDIAKLPLRAIVGVGATPLRYFTRGTEMMISSAHGIKFPVNIGGKDLWYYPVYHPSFVLRYGGDKGPAYPAFYNDMRLFFRDVDKWPDPKFTTFDPKKVIIAQSEQEVRDIVGRMQQPIGWDIETNTLRPFTPNAKMLTSAFSDGKLTVAYTCEHPEAPNDWGLRVTKDIVASMPVICHNAAFEMLWYCYYFGLENLPKEFRDTMALARIKHERESMLSLAALSRIYLGTDVKLVSHVDTRRIMDYPLDHILPYNGLDAEATALLFHQLVGHADPWQVQKIIGTIKSTMAMELKGLPVDLAESKNLHDAWALKRDSAEETAKQIYEVRQYQIDKQVEFNIGSNQQIADCLREYGRLDLPKTEKKGADSTAHLEKFVDVNPLAKLVVEYREANKLCSTYIEPILLGNEVAADGNIHPGYTTMHTATLRLSGTNMNIQNWPKRKHKEIRKQIRAPKGQIIVSIDYGQLEARVMAMASNDRFLCEAIITGYDIHSDWRDRLLKLYPPYMDRLIAKSGKTDDKSLMKAGRDNIKNDFVFASFFGSSPKSCAEYTGVPLPVMQDLSEDFWTTFKDVRRWIKGQRRLYIDTGTTSTLTGRVRRAVLFGNECINTPIQGTAADIVVESQNEVFELSQQLKDPFLQPRIQVHDDITFLLPDNSELERYIDQITSILVKRRFPFITVPLMVEVSIGYNWAEMEEITKVTGDYHR